MKFQIINEDLAELAWSFKVNEKSCENPEFFENYLRFSALNDYRDGKNVTHVLINYEKDKTPEIVGYFALRATSYQINFYDTDEGIENHPACEIQYLAVDKKYESKGCGKELMSQAISIILDSSETKMAIEYLVLRSEKNAVNFYQKFDLKPNEKYGKVPKESWNKNCIPMSCKLK